MSSSIVVYEVLDNNYVKFPRKNNSFQKLDDYTEACYKVIDRQPYNTPTNMSRQEEVKEVSDSYHHTQATAAVYCRKVVKDPGKIKMGDRTWQKYVYEGGKVVDYEPLSEEQVEFLKNAFKKYCYVDRFIDIEEQYKNGEISKVEKNQMIGEESSRNFQKAISDFIKEYKFTPHKVPLLVRVAF